MSAGDIAGHLTSWPSSEPSVRYLEAPVKAGDSVGDLTVLLNGKPQGTIPVVAKAGVDRAGFFGRLSQKIGRML